MQNNRKITMGFSSMDDGFLSLNGTVENIVFQNAVNGWTVLELNDGEELLTVVGTFFDVAAGDGLRVTGAWVNHPSYGRQFKSEIFEKKLPSDVSAILKYLSSKAVKGIGPATAEKIVGLFGERTLEVIENEPLELTKVKGITAKKANQISEDFKRQSGIRSAMLFLQRYGITAAETVRIWKLWGQRSVQMVKDDPYALCGTGLWISFERADQIAGSMGVPKNDPNRIKSGVMHVLRHNTYSVGHTYVPFESLAATAAEMLDVSADEAEAGIDAAADEELAVAAPVAGRRAVFLPEAFKAESTIAGRLELFLKTAPVSFGDAAARIDVLEEKYGIHYAERQREAVETACSRGLMIITGGPGTGKTTTIKAIIAVYEGMGLKVALAAPTGRAAKRMSELCGHEAKTIHRLLEMEYAEDDTPRFQRNEKNQLDCDAVIVDELSMVDVMLLESLLRAMKLNCRLIMVGDKNQLPPVGAGNALGDMTASGKIPYIMLDEIFRQAAKSKIVTNAHLIVRGDMPELNCRGGDFFFMRRSAAAQVKQTVRELVETRLPAAYGYSPLWDIQVLTPGRKGELGSSEFNVLLQQAINPAAEGKPEMRFGSKTFRLGDKVMQIKNNYDIVWEKPDGEKGSGVFNGDIGSLCALDRRTGLFKIRFDDDRSAEYAPENFNEIDLAYAATVHKSQGSEFKAVVLPLFSGAPQLFYRNLLYTAVTRARELVVIVGSEQTVCRMVENDRKTKRFTALEEFLKNGIPQEI